MQRLDTPTDLYESLAEVGASFGARDGWVRGRGVVRDVRLSVQGPEGPVVTFESSSSATILSLDAPISDGVVGRVSVVVVSLESGAPTVHAGYVDRAVVVDVELDVTGGAPVAAKPAASAPAATAPVATASASDAANPWAAVAAASAASASARPAPAAPAPAAKPAPAPAPVAANPWAAVAAASDAVADDEIEEVDPDELKRNDVLLHPKLGRCWVVSVINDNAVKVRLANRAVRKLMLTIFVIERTAEPNVYGLTKRNRG